MIYLTGDYHGGVRLLKPDGTFSLNKLNTANFPEGKTLTKKDYVIITGDFCVPFYNPTSKNHKEDLFLIKWFNDKPWTTLFVDGNHENFDNLKVLPEVKMFGNMVGKLSDSIFHLKRGRIYTIENNTFLALGGALSQDKDRRLRDQSLKLNLKIWWDEEYWTREEENNCMDNIDRVGGVVDYVISHTVPLSLIPQISEKLMEKDVLSAKLHTREYQRDVVSVFFESLINNELKGFKKWYFGHFHSDIDLGKYCGLFDRVKKLDK